MTEEFERRFLSARRDVIAQRFSSLNPQQREAVLTTEGPMLLLAGAGSGKTTVLIYRIANLLQFGCASDVLDVPDYITEEHVLFLEEYLRSPSEQLREQAERLCVYCAPAPWNIIAITFTNKAAGELKNRLEAMLGETALDIWAMTFHSACCRILRRYIDRLGYDRNFTIYDTADSERVMKDVMKNLSLDEKSFTPRAILNRISTAKDQQTTPADFIRMAQKEHNVRDERIGRAYEEYQLRLREANAVDFDDIILLAVQLLQKDEEVRSYYQQKFRYVLIDEYQDTNRLQDRLATLLSGYHQNICVVGDDDQSIYRFRGATIENILSFEKRYPGAGVIRLEQNYRSTGYILDAANGVISHNMGRKGKELWTAKGSGEKIHLYEAYNESDEANYVAAKIVGGRAQAKRFSEYAVLYRTNAQSNAIEYAFKRNGIPYRIIGGTRFFDRAEVKDILAYLCLINNRSDDLRLLRILNNPPRGIGQKTIDQVSRQAECAGIPLYEVISRAQMYPGLEKAAGKLQAFTDMIEKCSDMLSVLPLPEFYDAVLECTGYMAMLENKNTQENQTRAENIRELKSSLVNYTENAEEATLHGFLEEVALYTDLEQYNSSDDSVVMMTIHSAKGLEFPHVFLTGAEEGLFPGIRTASEPEALEEERRLCYVAITRAGESLTITYAKQRMLYGHTTRNRPSRFISELPAACLETGIRQTHVREVHTPPDLSMRTTPGRKSRPVRAASSEPVQMKLEKGEIIEHKAFGRGMVLSVQPMGNDALLEIAFDESGTRKFMARAVSAYIKKL